MHKTVGGYMCVVAIALLSACQSTCFVDGDERYDGYIRMELRDIKLNAPARGFINTHVFYPKQFSFYNPIVSSHAYEIPISVTTDSVMLALTKNGRTDTIVISYERKVERYDKCKGYDHYLVIHGCRVTYNSSDSFIATVYSDARSR